MINTLDTALNMPPKNPPPVLYNHLEKQAVLRHFTTHNNSTRAKKAKIHYTQNPTPEVEYHTTPGFLDDTTNTYEEYAPSNPVSAASIGINERVSTVLRENTVSPLRTWMRHRNDYLDEAMRAEGRGKKALDTGCRGCWLAEGTVRCEDCFGGELWCRPCTVTRHAMLPLHLVKVCYNVYLAPEIY